MIERYRRQREIWLAHTDELLRLDDAVRDSGDRGAIDVVTATQREIDALIWSVQRRLLAPAPPGPDAARPGDTAAARTARTAPVGHALAGALEGLDGLGRAGARHRRALAPLGGFPMDEPHQDGRERTRGVFASFGALAAVLVLVGIVSWQRTDRTAEALADTAAATLAPAPTVATSGELDAEGDATTVAPEAPTATAHPPSPGASTTADAQAIPSRLLPVPIAAQPSRPAGAATVPAPVLPRLRLPETNLVTAGEHWLDAYQRRGATGLEAPDLSVSDARQPAERFAPGLQTVSRELDAVSLDLSGDTAVLSARMTERIEGDAASGPHVSRVSQTWQRHEGEWQLTSVRIVSEARFTRLLP